MLACDQLLHRSPLYPPCRIVKELEIKEHALALLAEREGHSQASQLRGAADTAQEAVEAAQADAAAAQARLTDMQCTAEVPPETLSTQKRIHRDACKPPLRKAPWLSTRTQAKSLDIACHSAIAAHQSVKSWRVQPCRSSSARRRALQRRAAAALRRRRRSCRPPSSRCYSSCCLSAGCRFNICMPQPMPARRHITASCRHSMDPVWDPETLK